VGANRSVAARASVRVLVLSRGWVFLCAAASFLAFGADSANTSRYANPAIADPFGGAGQALLGIWSRWDSVWYLGVAHSGYDFAPPSAAFFPLYPLLSRAIGTVGELAPVGSVGIFLAALVISLVALGIAVYLLHRLTALELGPEVATLTVALFAFFPMALFFGAIYSESLFLALSLGAFWFARSDRWALAGLCGAGAAATRSAGVLLVAPLLLLYLLGPRGIGARAQPYLGVPWGRRDGPRTYPLRADALWIALVPAAVAVYVLYLGIDFGDPLRFTDAQDVWSRELGHVGPVPAAFVGGIWQGVSAAVRGLADLIGGSASLADAVWAPDGGGSLAAAGVNVEAMLFLVFGIWATIGVLRRLPLAYGAYAGVALALALSFPRSADAGYDVPLFSLPRFIAVIFPLFMWLALAVHERGWERPALVVSAALLGLYAAQWGTWQWVS
jgi:mannosyltransferase PIG-V